MEFWFLKPVDQGANKHIVERLQGDVTDSEPRGAQTSEGRRDLYRVEYEKVL